jgi:predicted nucleic acid-binding protein
MELVVDSNIIFSAMISDSVTREILLDSGHSFYSPDFIKSEITKYRDLITEKSGLNEKEFEVLLDLILDEIEIQAKEEYENELGEAEEILGDQDIKDVPFLAVAIQKDCKIWSDDKDFQEQDRIDTVKTPEMIENY